MLKHLGPIVATALVVLILLAASVPLMHWFAAEGRQARFDESLAKWQDHSITGYEFTLSAEGSGVSSGPYTVIVSPGGGVELRGAGSLPSDLPATVEALFDRVAAAIEETGGYIDVAYDADYGYPERAVFEIEGEDGGTERTLQITYFRPLAADR